MVKLNIFFILLSHMFPVMIMMMIMIMMMFNCFYGMVLTLPISDTPREWFEPVQSLVWGFVGWSCAVVISTMRGWPPGHCTLFICLFNYLFIYLVICLFTYLLIYFEIKESWFSKIQDLPHILSLYIIIFTYLLGMQFSGRCNWDAWICEPYLFPKYSNILEYWSSEQS